MSNRTGRIRRTVFSVVPYDSKSFYITVKDYPICKPAAKAAIETQVKKLCHDLSKSGLRSQIDIYGKDGKYVKSEQFNEAA